MFSLRKTKNFYFLNSLVVVLVVRAPNTDVVFLKALIVFDARSGCAIFPLALHHRLLLSALTDQLRFEKVSRDVILRRAKLAEIALLAVSMIALRSLSHVGPWKKTTTKKLERSFCFKLKKLLISFLIDQSWYCSANFSINPINSTLISLGTIRFFCLNPTLKIDRRVEIDRLRHGR